MTHRSLFGLLGLVVACGSSTPPPIADPTTGSASTTAGATTSLAALSAVLGELEQLRPYVVGADGKPTCTAYTADTSAMVTNLAASTERADAARKQARPVDVVEWQRTHTPAIEKLIVEVSTPLRSYTYCEPMTKDETWKHVMRALVTIAEPPTPPDAIADRGAMMTKLLAAAETMTSEADCKAAMERLMAEHGASLEASFAKLTVVENFVDDHVWEEQQEDAMQAHPSFEKLSKFCPF